MDDNKAYQLLVKIAMDFGQDESEREEAIRGLARLGYPAALEVFEQLLEKGGGSPNFRLIVIGAIADLQIRIDRAEEKEDGDGKK